MNETQKRIKAYKEALPGIKERVLGVALLLVMSVVMMTSATFAWLTISRAPEVSGVSTTVAANGNLEIALASTDGSGKVNPPGESQVGDSFAAEGQSVVEANLTWGNLVNLSDASYGLDHLVLRPAQLNTASLLESPLYGAEYKDDGRISQLISSFGYATWNLPTEDKPGYFGVSDNVGVRAISSTKIEAVGAEAKYYNMVSNARNTNLSAASTYAALGNNQAYMQSLATMMGLYMTARMNPSNADLSNPTCNIADLQNLRDMYGAFLECFDMEAEAMAALANLSLFLQHGEGNYTPYNAEKIYATTTAKLKGEGVQITDLDQFIKDRNIIASDYEKLKTICTSGTSLKWTDSGLVDIVNHLVDVGKCTIGADNTPISSIGASNAMGYLSGTQEARITNGILYRFEERTGGYIQVKNLSISATVNRMGMTIPATVKANIQTTAPRDYNLFTNDLNYAESQNTGNYAGGIPVAEDTYGLAVDLWVRTNAQSSYLTLEGNVLTESNFVRATGKDPDGNTVELYTVTIEATDEEGNTASYDYDVYEGKAIVTDENGGQTEIDAWINAENHSVVTDEELNGATPLEKMEEVITVIGFEGENRVWTEKGLPTDATTQGVGSCYVYYADTPEDQARSLQLLESFNVAFIDSTGKLMATAIMDTEKYFAQDGRVIVPLVLNTSDSINLGEDYEGNTTYAITALEKNVPTRITAIVYLDGSRLTNDEVLAAADIQGQLNIQFGTSQDLTPIDNETLENKILSVSASVDKTSFDYDTATEPMTSKVSLTISGDQPNTVTAFFLRSINATQGSREEVMTFTQQDDGTWTADYTFTSPGNYVLRTVQLDGQEYVLSNTPTVTVTGFAVKNLIMSGDGVSGTHANIMTAENSSSVELSLQFATEDESKLPKSVQGRFLNDETGSAVNVNFTYNTTTQTWTGSATLLSSGDYTMEFLVLDGEYFYLDEAMHQTASITLGMKVAVYTTSPHSFKYVPSEMTDNQKLLAMQVKILDNTGEEMPGLSGVKLTYGMKGSGVKKMDADLVWNGSYYVGELPTTSPGIWQFSVVNVGGNTITNATTSPTFTILSPEPPEYYDHGTISYQYAPNNDATMNVQITNSAAAIVQAYIIENGATEGVWVDGTIGGELTTTDGKPANHWSFPVPKDANRYQDGNWKLTELRLWNVFAADGTQYTEEKPLVFDVSDTNNVTKVVNRVFVTFPEGKSQNFGTDANGNVTGAFMQSYNIFDLYVDIKDFEGEKIEGITEVKLAFTYGNNSSTYGGYTGPTNANSDFSVVLEDDGTGKHFAQKQDVTVRHAGSYATTFSFKVGEKPVSYSGDNLPANTPVFTVSSVTPAISLSGRTNYDGSSTNGTTITVAYGHSTETTCGITYHNYSQASVTLKLSGYGNASGAYLAFAKDGGGDVHLYLNKEDATNKKTDRYEWTADGECLRWVGYWNSQTGTDRATAAGTIKATELMLKYGTTEYSVDIEDITIINPTPPS